MPEFKRAHHEDLQRKAKSAGSHFFDPDTMRFFKSYVIEESFYANAERDVWYFATSEKGPDGRRGYTARVARFEQNEQGGMRVDFDPVDGTEFQQFTTRRRVNEFVNKLVNA